MSGNEKLARFALRHLDAAPLAQRPDLLLAAAAFLPPDESDLCVITASFIRHAEEHQLVLFNHFANEEAVLK